MPADKPKMKKPPTCDRCKAKRVLCHPAPPGQSCPRCQEKGVECTTTPVVRRKPVRKSKSDQVSPEHQAFASDGVASGSTTPLIHHHEPSPFAYPSTASGPSHQYTDDAQFPPIDAEALLTPQLLRSLVADVPRLPQKHHPLLMNQVVLLTDRLKTFNYVFASLPIPSQAFASTIAALISLVSIDPAILGPGPVPASLESLTVEDAANLAEYGARRAPACRALRNLAFVKAKEADVLLIASTLNATTCYLLDALQSLAMASDGASSDSRPYATCYIAHLRTLAANGNLDTSREAVVWSSFLMEEAVRSLTSHKSIVFTHLDELSLRGGDSAASGIVGLDVLLSNFRKASAKDSKIVFESVMPCSIEVVRIARAIETHISGAFARKRPLNETAVLKIVADLEKLQELQTAAHDRLKAMQPPCLARPFPPLSVVHCSPGTKSTEALGYLLSCVQSFFAFGVTAIVFSLHSALDERADAADPASSQAELRLAERLTLLRQQVQSMALNAARRFASAVDPPPSQPHSLFFRTIRMQTWVSLILRETDSNGLAEENLAALKSYSRTLKMATFTFHDADLFKLIADLDMRISMSTGFGAFPPPLPLPPAAPFVGTDGVFADPNIAAPFLDNQLDLDQWFQAAMLSAGMVDGSAYPSFV